MRSTASAAALVVLLVCIACSTALGQPPSRPVSIDTNKLATTTDQDLIKAVVVFSGWVGNGNEFQPTDRNPRAGTFPVYPASGSNAVTVSTGDLPAPNITVEVKGVVVSLQPTVVQEMTRRESGGAGGGAGVPGGWAGTIWAPENRPWVIGGAIAILLIVVYTVFQTRRLGAGPVDPVAGPGPDGTSVEVAPPPGGDVAEIPVGVAPAIPPGGPPTRGDRVGTLAVVKGEAPRSSYTITRGQPLVVGRGPHCDILAGTADLSISETHAQITVHPNGVCVVSDLGSSNGTWVNDVFIAAPHALAAHDVVRVGSTSLRFDPDHAPAPGPESTVAGAATEGGTRPPGGTADGVDATAGAAAGTRVAWLEEVEGPEKGRRFAISGTRTTLGRASDNTIVLGEGSVSRHQAAIELSGGRMTLTDLSTYKTTYLNGESVQSAELKDGDRIRLGDVTEVVLSWGGGA